MAKSPEKNGKYTLQVPLDASDIEGFKPESKVKVLAVDNHGNTNSALAELNAKGKGAATLKFSENPGALRVIVGPEDASDEELQGLQTIQTRVAARQWRDSNQVALADIRISPLLLVVVVALVPGIHNSWSCTLPKWASGPRGKGLRLRCGCLVVVEQ